ncbi:methyltransferase domain-containing protein [Streptomyces sp. NPDC051940]|uniref:class I SAM-dependent methyltransferase n=1 Tax=Streptomyces sp. NPDC051940 TaxID=3155675 RepID=UPI00342542CD
MTDTDAPPHGFDPEILAYYEKGRENGRLRASENASNRLEFWRTQDVLRRRLPAPPGRVLDVGGGSGVHAEWLAADGYAVELVDPVPLHVAQASALPGVAARVGDARDLDCADGVYDAVLVLGPLYHLPERADRLRALREAARAVRPGGVIAAAAISRYAGVNDTLREGRYFEAEVRERMDPALVDGRLGDEGQRLFTTAYFHDPAEIAGEFHEAGLTDVVSHGLEGTAWLMPGMNGHLDDPERRARVLDLLRRLESAPSLIGASGHILTTAVRG